MNRIFFPVLSLALAVSCVGTQGTDHEQNAAAPASAAAAPRVAATERPAEPAPPPAAARPTAGDRRDAPATASGEGAKQAPMGASTTRGLGSAGGELFGLDAAGAGSAGLGGGGRGTMSRGLGLAERKVASGKRGAMDKSVRRRVRHSPATAPAPMRVATRPMASAPADREVDGRFPNSGGTFVHAGTNPIVRTSDDRQSTFSVDVDTASYNYARRFLERGTRPNPGSVRVEEWVNAFHYDYEGPGAGAPFAIHLDGAPSPFNKERHLVRVGIQGQHVKKQDRKPVHLTFLVDVSGSMQTADKLPLAQRSLHLLTNQLDARDSVSLAVYAGRTGEVLSQTRATSAGKARIHRAIDDLRSGGGTNMGSGMEIAYRNAGKFVSSDSVSRVIVLSDGDANIGRTSHDAILKSIKGYVSEGVKMSTIGFGTGNYRDHLMEQLADAGDGNYTYIDSEKAAKKAFVDDLTGTLQVIAKDVKIQVEFDPAYVSAYRLIGYENRDIADKDFANDKVDAGEIGAGHTVTALYEVVLTDAAKTAASRDALATVRVRYKTPKGTRSTKTERTLKLAHMQDRFSDLDDNVRFAAAVTIAAEVLRGSEHAAHLTLDDAWALASEALEGPYKEERQEFVNLMNTNRRHHRDEVAWR